MNIRREHPGEVLVLGPSLGSSRRDHATTVRLLDRPIRLFRKGTDGSFSRLLQLYREYDGRVDAFGLGGAEFSVQAAGRRYYFRQGKQIQRAVHRTPIGDGNGVKHLLERRAVEALATEGISLKGTRALCVSAMDRMGLAQALVDQGCRTLFGDLVFSLGLPLPLRSLEAVDRVGRLLLPLVTQLPYSLLYPLGEKQEREPRARHRRYLEEAEILAGDYNWLRTHLPLDLRGKVIVTNSTTAADVELLRNRGLRLLVTGTPRLEGRSFGTNVVEAMLLALIGKPQKQVQEADFAALIDAVPLRPALEWLNR